MSNVDMCEHGWPGTGCRECMREAHEDKVSQLEDRFLDEVENRMMAEAKLFEASKLALKAQARIEELEEKVKELDVWSRFAGYLLDNCEGQTIWEESLQYWLSDMLKKEKEQ